jgi:hypothetical protein
MKFIEHLYVSKSIKNVNRVIWKLKHNAGQIKIYITAISKHPTDQLDIYHCSVLQQKYFHKDKDFTIVAITDSHEGAVEFVQLLTEQCLKTRGDCNLREYLLSESFTGIIDDRG